MDKTIALQGNNQKLANLLQQQGYTVIDMYQAHLQRESVDAYLYTTYHPAALTTYHSVAEPEDSMLDSEEELASYPSTLMLNITNLTSKQILLTLERQLQAR